ncbi:MAG: leucyl aminopeptidase [Actinomycetota bacterium]
MIEFRAGTLEEAADALLIGVGAERAWDESGRWLAARMGGWLEGYLDGADFTGKEGEVLCVPGAGLVAHGTVVLVGLGAAPDAEAVRRAAGSAGRALTRAGSVVTTLGGSVAGGEAAVALGFLLGQYSFQKHRSEPKAVKTTSLSFVGAGAAALVAAEKAGVVAAAVAKARDLVNEPSRNKPPEFLAGVAREIGERTGVRVKVHGMDDLVAGGFGGILGVNAGATEPARLVEMWYEPPGAEAFFAMVGKGIVFDSGGLSLKPADAMETMKTDMSGAAAVLAAVEAIATLGIPVRILALTPLTENMPSGSALRPGDVLKVRNGKTIEVLNTDAEGRLVLADGLSLAAESAPDLIVDLATLTGACMIALGEEIAGLFGTGGAPEKVRCAAEAAGERVWPMPLPADYRKKIDSDVADMKNTGPRYGGAINAALLLKEFVGDIPWAHLDIAGPARAPETAHYLAKGGTGFGVRTLVALAEALAAGS